MSCDATVRLWGETIQCQNVGPCEFHGAEVRPSAFDGDGNLVDAWVHVSWEAAE